MQKEKNYISCQGVNNAGFDCFINTINSKRFLGRKTKELIYKIVDIHYDLLKILKDDIDDGKVTEALSKINKEKRYTVEYKNNCYLELGNYCLGKNLVAEAIDFYSAIPSGGQEYIWANRKALQLVLKILAGEEVDGTIRRKYEIKVLELLLRVNVQASDQDEVDQYIRQIASMDSDLSIKNISQNSQSLFQLAEKIRLLHAENIYLKSILTCNEKQNISSKHVGFFHHSALSKKMHALHVAKNSVVNKFRQLTK